MASRPNLERVAAVFHAALELQADRRDAFLARECGDDLELRREVESLLAADDDAGDFLERPAAVALGLAGPDTTLAGRELGPYRIDREIGRGGMGVVYLGEDLRLGRKVAIKVLAPEYTRDEQRRRRLRLEARAAAALSHPGIATVYALEEIGDDLCLVCEYVPGRTLRDEMAAGPVPAATIVETGVQLASALAAAHAAGVVHRDLKPENVIRSEGGGVKILDFGVARIDQPDASGSPRLTAAGTVIGTPAYMSPEQIEGGDVDARSDVFALGVLLYEMAAGVHPFEAKTPGSTAARVLAAEPPDLVVVNPRLPRPLERVIARCLRKSRDDRYASAAAAAADLESLRGIDTIPVGPLASSSGPAEATAAARRWWVAHQAGAMAVAAIVVVPVWVLHRAAGHSDVTLALLLGVVAAAMLNGTLRAHLLFTHAFNRGELLPQLRRTEAGLRRSDLVFSAAVLAAAVPMVRTWTGVSATLGAVAIAWAVASLVIEPATRRAAFPGLQFER